MKLKGIIKVSKYEVDRFIKRKSWPDTRRYRKKARRKIRRFKDRIGRDISITQADSPWQIIYGRARVGGVFTYARLRDKRRNLLVVVTIACHQIEAVEKLFLDGEEVAFGGGNVGGWATGKYANHVFAEVNLGSEHQSALTQLITDSDGQWTADHRQRGRAHVYLKLVASTALFPQGLPDIEFQVQGYNLMSGGWTENSARVVEGYLFNRSHGCSRMLGQSSEKTDAVSICDEDVALAAGGTEKRYTSGGSWLVTDSRRKILQDMLSGMGGKFVDLDNYWYANPIVAASYRSPSMSLTEDDVLSEISVDVMDSLSEHFDAIRGTYVDPENNWEESDFPPYNPDGFTRPMWDDIQLPVTQSASRAQRLAKIEYTTRKNALRCEFIAHLRVFKLIPTDTITLTYDRFNWTSKVFEIEKMQLTWVEDENGNRFLGVRLALRSTASSDYAWDESTEETGIPGLVPLDEFGEPIPDDVEGFHGTIDGSELLLEWLAAEDVDYYSVRVTTSGEDYDNATEIDRTTSLQTTYTVNPGITYTFYIKAVSEYGDESENVTTFVYSETIQAGMATGIPGLTYS